MLRVGARLQWYATARIDLDQGAAGSRQASQGKPRTTSCTHCCHGWHPPSMLAAANPSLPFPRVAASIKRSRAGSAPVTENSEQDDGEPTGKAKHCRECTPAFIAQRLWTSNKQAIRSYPSGDGPCLTDARPMVAWRSASLWRSQPAIERFRDHRYVRWQFSSASGASTSRFRRWDGDVAAVHGANSASR